MNKIIVRLRLAAGVKAPLRVGVVSTHMPRDEALSLSPGLTLRLRNEGRYLIRQIERMLESDERSSDADLIEINCFGEWISG